MQTFDSPADNYLSCNITPALLQHHQLKFFPTFHDALIVQLVGWRMMEANSIPVASNWMSNLLSSIRVLGRLPAQKAGRDHSSVNKWMAKIAFDQLLSYAAKAIPNSMFSCSEQLPGSLFHLSTLKLMA